LICRDKNIQEAIDLIGKTAQLDFRELPSDVPATASANIFQFIKTDLNGKDLKQAKLDYSSETGEPVSRPAVLVRRSPQI